VQHPRVQGPRRAHTAIIPFAAMHSSAIAASLAVFLPTASAFLGAPLPLLAARSRADSLAVNMQDPQASLNRRRFVGTTIGGAAVSDPPSLFLPVIIPGAHTCGPALAEVG